MSNLKRYTVYFFVGAIIVTIINMAFPSYKYYYKDPYYVYVVKEVPLEEYNPTYGFTRKTVNNNALILGALLAGILILIDPLKKIKA
jgi:hypothetical protein